MSDDNNINDSFERFFRKKADEYEIMFNEADWEKLNKRLDVLDAQRAIAKKRFLAGAAILLVFALFGYFTYQNYTTINRLEQQLNNQTVRQNEPNTAIDINNDGSPNEASPEMGTQPSLTGNEQRVNAGRKTIPQTGHPEPDNTGHGLKNNNVLISRVETAALAVTEVPDQLFETTLPVQLENPAETLIPAPNPSLKSTRLTASRNKTPENPAAAYREPVHTFSRFAIGFALAPDFSTVGSLSDFYTPGYKIGMSLEYNFNGNFGISAGIIHSTVRYTASGDEYQPSGDYWNYGVIPAETQAECILLDIPVTLKYNFLDFGRSRLFATAGISTYIMLNEVYAFNYYGNEPDLAQRWSAKTGTRHWASNAGFSIGFEYDLTSTLSLRAEPFIKVPLRKVGWGNVDLYSTGSFISLYYHFN